MEIAAQAEGGVGRVEFCLSGAEACVGDAALLREARGGCGGEDAGEAMQDAQSCASRLWPIVELSVTHDSVSRLLFLFLCNIAAFAGIYIV